jgi:pyridoxamine 5'-phosphate oxidase family protein
MTLPTSGITVQFSKKEIDYIRSQHLARIGTASRKGDPDVAAVGFDFDGVYFYIGGLDVTRTLKYKNVLENPKASFVVDDLISVEPFRPRMLKVRGPAEIVDHKGYAGPGKYIRIKPTHKSSFGID